MTGETHRKITMSPTIFVFSREIWGIECNILSLLDFSNSESLKVGEPAREKKVGEKPRETEPEHSSIFPDAAAEEQLLG